MFSIFDNDTRLEQSTKLFSTPNRLKRSKMVNGCSKITFPF